MLNTGYKIYYKGFYYYIMKILFYRYGSIVEQHMIDCFNNAGVDIIQDTRHISESYVSPEQIVADVAEHLKNNSFLFVFSINFFPEVSDVCNIYNITYVSWTVDSPFIQLFSKSLNNKCNKIFFFDRAQYERFGIPLGSDHGFYLPLAGNPVHFARAIRNASSADISRFTSDISFIGSLYNEKNPYTKITGISDYLKGYVDSIEQAQMQIFGDNIIENCLSEKVMHEFESLVPDIQNPEESADSKRYKIAHFVIGSDLAYRERVITLSTLASYYNVDLYTLSDTSDLKNVNVRGSANTFTEMPIIFNKSRVNLNITMRPIITGLSQRIYDVLSCGGFLLTNYQQELPELFDIGTELDCYSSQEELVEKAAYYLTHDEIRQKIALNGFEKIKQCHTFEHRFKTMLATILNS